MGQVLKVRFDHFKELANERRIYYFDTPDYIDLHFLFEGFIIKTTLLSEQIEDKKKFFSDKMFYGAKPIDFRIPDTDSNNAQLVLQREPATALDVQSIQDEETKKTDIQQEGVDADSND